jgi:hypothetical protein
LISFKILLLGPGRANPVDIQKGDVMEGKAYNPSEIGLQRAPSHFVVLKCLADLHVFHNLQKDIM